MSAEDKGFEIRDRRMREEDSRSAKSASPTENAPRSDSSVSFKKSPGETIHFSDFVFSLSASALVHLGVEPDPQKGDRAINLNQASELIDLLSLLEEKTRGNLTSDESSFLSNTLYMLRMKFVETAKQHPRQPEGCDG